MASTAETAKQLLADPRPQPGRSLAEVLVDLRERIRDGQPIIHTLPTGWNLLDETVGGLVRGEYIGFVAAPGVGKSTLCDQIMVQTLIRNPEARGIIFALETSTAVRAARLVANACFQKGPTNQIVRCVPIRALLRGELSGSAIDLALQGVAGLDAQLGCRLRFIDDATADVQIAEIIRTQRPDALLIDHFGLVASSSTTASEIARADESLTILLGAIHEANSAALIINEISKSALATGKIDLVASRGTARFASLAALYIGIDRLLVPGQRDPKLVATIHKSRFGDSFRHQAAIFYGGLCHFEWGPLDVEQEEDPSRPGRTSVSGANSESAEAADSESKIKSRPRRKAKKKAAKKQ